MISHSRFLLVQLALLFSLSSPFATAQTYTLQDLQTLVDRKEYSEAVSHLRDITPTARNAAWDDVVVKALIGNADNVRKDSAGEAYRYLGEGMVQFPSAAKDARLTGKLVEFGIGAMKERRFYARDEREKIVETLLQIDPSLIVPLVTESGYDDSQQRIYAWVDRNPQAVRSNPALKEYLLRNAGRKTTRETAAMSQTKFAALKKAGLIDEWAKTEYARVATYAAEMMRGEFTHQDSGRVLLNLLEEAGYKNEDARVRFFAPLALMRSSTRSVDPLEMILSASPSSLKKAERELLASKPDQGFWFGGVWDEDLFAKVRKIFPEVVKLSQEECKAFNSKTGSEPRKDAAHVSYGGCTWIK